MFVHVPLWIAFVCVVCGAALGRLFVFDRSAMITRRENATKAAQTLAKMGLTILPKILTAYGAGDYAGLAHYIKDAAEQLIDPAKAAQEFETLFTNMLTAQMSDATDGPAVLAQVIKLAQVNGIKVPTTTAAPALAA